MVVFTCNNCGDSLQKPKVAKHFQFKCRNPVALTCVDCLKDFVNNEYAAHTKCITEAERYGGKNFVPKPSANKGEKKQQEWINIVNNVLTSSTNLTNEERTFLESIAKYDNIPRKKVKYLNFVKNALGYRINYNIVESCWEKMESAFKQATESYKTNQKSNNNENNITSTNDNCHNYNDRNDNATNGAKDKTNLNNGLDVSKKQNSTSNKIIDETKDDEVIKKELSQKKKRKNVEQIEMVVNENNNQTDESQKKSKSKKKKLNHSESISQNSNLKENHTTNGSKIENSEEIKDNNESQKFNWKAEILQILEIKQEISLKKLKKKVLQKYSSAHPDVLPDTIESRFNKKLNKMSELIISDDKVKLTSS